MPCKCRTPNLSRDQLEKQAAINQLARHLARQLAPHKAVDCSRKDLQRAQNADSQHREIGMVGIEPSTSLL